MMEYDRKNGGMGATGLSCAFHACRTQFHGPVTKYDWSNYRTGDQPRKVVETQEQYEGRMWDTLCQVLTASETRPVLLPTTSKEPEWEALLEMCPLIELIDSTKSKHGNYQAKLWIARKHSKPAVTTTEGS